MNQHKDLLYRQKYATYQLNNRTFSTQNTKISARSLAISYICFQVRIVKKKRGGGGESHTINYYGKSGDSRTPDPRQGLYTRNCNGRNYTSYHSWRPSWRPLFAENSRASGGSAPWAPGRGPLHPARGPTAGPWTPPVWGARFAHTRCATRTDFSAHPFFCKSWIRHCTHPPLLVQVACPQRRRSWGSWGAVAPPPPPNENFFFWGGGANISFCPPPPPIISSTWKIDNM